MTLEKAVLTSATLKTVGIFGGTFDPPHIGHLRMALELKARLNLDEMRLVPCHIPPHRQTPIATAEQRLTMVEAAISRSPDLLVDRIELENDQPSYSVHTLQALREELGAEVSLCLAIGMDSLISLDSWHQWQDLLSLANIIVAARPGWQAPSEGPLAEYIAQHRGEPADVQLQSQGVIVIETLSLLSISSSDIRQRLQQDQSIQFLVPDAVLHYIQQHNVYPSSGVI